MRSSEAQTVCQIQSLDYMADPNAKVIVPPLSMRLRLKLTRRMAPQVKRAILRYSDWVLNRSSQLIGRSEKAFVPSAKPQTSSLKAGDPVRVRSQEEIGATLNYWRQLKGCTFMEEMKPFCGTTQRVLKPVERFLDERDYRIKKTRGIILLEGLTCQGTERFGRCDRSCFYFWREEWLEKID
jgi:hypothetical protein